MIAQRLRTALLTGATLALLFPPLADLSAQHGEPPPASAHAVRGVTVVGPDGAREEGMTLVVRDGLLASVSADTTVPADARVLEGDSLFAYPGLVDAEGEARFEFPGAEEEDDEREEVAAWDPPRDVQGFLPHRRAVDALTATGDDLEEAREAGVVASASHPGDALAPGRGVLLIHRSDAELPRELVLRPELGPVLAFDGAGVYPGTLMGLIAFLRQGFADADHHGRLAAAHTDDATGMTAPGWDPDLEVLSRAAAGEVPVYFRADRAEDIRRVLELSEELGFRPVVVGGEEAWKVADRLREAQVSVLVSLDFPTPQRWDPDDEGARPEEEATPDSAAGDEAPPAGGDPAGAETTRAGEVGADTSEAEQELEPEVLREKRRLEDAYANAGRLHEAGVRFALTSGGGDADLLEGARRAVEYGLPEEAAVRALTSTPAELLEVPWLARVDQGRAATFVVTDGPLLGEDTEILYTFVEGRLQRAAEPGKEPEEPPAADVTGSWAMEIEASMGSFDMELELEQEGARFEGTARGQFGTVDVEDGLVAGTDVSFTISIEGGGQTFELSFSGTVEGDAMSGSGSGPPQMGSFTWEASRTSGPGAGR